VDAELTNPYGSLLRQDLTAKLEAVARERRENPLKNPQLLQGWGSIEGQTVETVGWTGAKRHAENGIAEPIRRIGGSDRATVLRR
jgi:hypothetical protein